MAGNKSSTPTNNAEISHYHRDKPVIRPKSGHQFCHPSVCPHCKEDYERVGNNKFRQLRKFRTPPPDAEWDTCCCGHCVFRGYLPFK